MIHNLAGTDEQVDFLKNKLVPVLQQLGTGHTGSWGVMNAQQMVEHLADSFRNMYGFDSTRVFTAPEHLPKFRDFLMSEKVFRPGTKNPGLPETPPPPRFATMEASIADLKEAVDAFFVFFEKNSGSHLIHPVFGELDYEAYVRLLHKHALHHLKQFGIE